MQISSTFLILVLVVFIFAPSIQDWVTQGGAVWYRPYIVWLIVILLMRWGVRRIKKRTQVRAKEEIR